MYMESFIEEISKNLYACFNNFRNYDEARKAYLNALRHDPSN